jgi:hypothetical protein
MAFNRQCCKKCVAIICVMSHCQVLFKQTQNMVNKDRVELNSELLSGQQKVLG